MYSSYDEVTRNTPLPVRNDDEAKFWREAFLQLMVHKNLVLFTVYPHRSVSDEYELVLEDTVDMMGSRGTRVTLVTDKLKAKNLAARLQRYINEVPSPKVLEDALNIAFPGANFKLEK